MKRQSNSFFSILPAAVAGLLLSCGSEAPSPDLIDPAASWQKVQEILAGTKDIIVLDGTEPAPLRYEGRDNPTYGDWMVFHFLSDPENFNPYTSNDAGASRVHRYIFDSLLYAENEPPFALKGSVAKAYPQISEDHLTYTFELRDNVRFADGRPMTVDDVIFSMKVIHNPRVLAAHVRNYYAAVRDVRKVGPSKISFVCREPYFRNDISLGSFEILPRHFYDADGLMDPVPVRSLIDGTWEAGSHKDRVVKFADAFNQAFNRRMLGSGPYLVKDWEQDVITGQKVVLTRNPDYWGRGVEGLPATGYTDRIVFKIINNEDAAFIELTNGNLDVRSLRPLEFKDKSWSPNFVRRFFKGIEYSSGYTYIGWNNAHPLFRDLRVRRAMTHLIDRQGLVENLLLALGETVEGPIHKFRPEYNHGLKPYEFDPELALQLLEEAGWGDSDNDGMLDKEIRGKRTPFKFEFLVNSGNQLRKDIALTLQSELEDIGIVCQVRELDWSIFLDRVKNQEFAAVTLGWSGGGGVRFPPDAYQVWHSSQAEGRGSNFIGFKNGEVDEILEAYRREFDMDKRISLYRRFQEVLHAEQPYTFLWKSRVARAYNRRFRGVNWYPGGSDTQEWFVAAGDRLYQ